MCPNTSEKNQKRSKTFVDAPCAVVVVAFVAVVPTVAPDCGDRASGTSLRKALSSARSAAVRGGVVAIAVALLVVT